MPQFPPLIPVDCDQHFLPPGFGGEQNLRLWRQKEESVYMQSEGCAENGNVFPVV